ncbi:MAG: four helix bundle protein [Bacteroidia bacterium]
MSKRKRHNFRELTVWKKARQNNPRIYLLTKKFPDDEKFGMKSQIKRASVSIMSNIAEGAGRRTNKDFVNFLGMAHGSATEVENLLIVGLDLGFITKEKFTIQKEYLHEIQKMMNGLMDSLEKSDI